MTLKNELSKLRPLLGSDSPEFYNQVKDIATRYNSAEDKKVIADFISDRLQNIDKKMNELLIEFKEGF